MSLKRHAFQGTDPAVIGICKKCLNISSTFHIRIIFNLDYCNISKWYPSPFHNTVRILYQKFNPYHEVVLLNASLGFLYTIQTQCLLCSNHTCLMFFHSSPQILLYTKKKYCVIYTCIHMYVSTHTYTTHTHTHWKFIFLEGSLYRELTSISGYLCFTTYI